MDYKFEERGLMFIERRIGPPYHSDERKLVYRGKPIRISEFPGVINDIPLDSARDYEYVVSQVLEDEGRLVVLNFRLDFIEMERGNLRPGNFVRIVSFPVDADSLEEFLRLFKK